MKQIQNYQYYIESFLDCHFLKYQNLNLKNEIASINHSLIKRDQKDLFWKFISCSIRLSFYLLFFAELSFFIDNLNLAFPYHALK